MPANKIKYCSNYHDKIWNDKMMGFEVPEVKLHRVYIKITKNKKTKWIGVGWYCLECKTFEL